MMPVLLALWSALALASPSPAEAPHPEIPHPEVRGHIDWQAHPAMHLAWKVYGKGLLERTPRRTWRHAIRQTMAAPWVRDSGVRLLLAGAIAAEKARSPAQARALILEQLAYVEAFVASDPEHFALAKSPAEARHLLQTTDKQVVVHSIEGGRMILQDPGDAQFWAEQGVALITLIHLIDDELGGAAVNHSHMGRFINREGVRKRDGGEHRGLTERGRQAIVELDGAGILVDLTHMSPQSIDETLALTAEAGITPVVTHGKLHRITGVERAFSDAQIVEIYRQGGVFNLAVSGGALLPHDPVEPVPEGLCQGSLDTFGWNLAVLQRVLDAGLPEIFGLTSRDQLSEAQKTALATGWASDWNGGINHSRPRYGRAGCEAWPGPGAPLPVDHLGLAHPGLLPQYWQRLEEDGADLDPLMRSAERFLQLWEGAGS